MGKYNNEPRLHSSSDDKGHNAKFQVRVNPDWIHQIDIIVKNKKFPYVNRGQLARDAIYRHLLWLNEFETPPDSILQKIQSMVDMLEEAKIQQDFEKVVASLEERVAYFGSKGARSEAVKYVLRILGYIDEMPEGHWKDEFTKEIRGRYSGLIQCTPRASLMQTCVSEND